MGKVKATRTKVNIHQAKTQLSKLLRLVALGEEVIIAKAGKPVAKLVPITDAGLGPRPMGIFAGTMWASPDFDEPEPEVVRLFEDGPIEPPPR